MGQFTLFLLVILLAECIVGLPVNKVEEKKPEELTNEVDSDEFGNDLESNLEYERYLREVVGALETDQDFRQKLDNASEHDVRSGKIAHQLEFVDHRVRTKLDEIKRQEMERLRLAAMRQFELTNDIDREHLKISEPQHIDHQNEHTFEIEDLKKLIQKTSEDLAKADAERRKEFKEYELQKEFEKQEKLRSLDEEHRKEYEEEIKKKEQVHNEHEKVHHPGSKAQLEEVWEKKDHMDKEDFNPVTFFMTHDVDGNGQLDEVELKAIFQTDLDKVYQASNSEDDMNERAEEMERMREHVMKEVDTNGDRMVSLDELIAQTKREEFNRDPGWETVDKQPQFTHEEYVEFERRRQAEIQQMIAQGRLPPHPNMPNGYYPNEQHGAYQQHPGAGQHPQYHHQQQQQQYQHAQQVQYQHPPPAHYQHPQDLHNQQRPQHIQQPPYQQVPAQQIPQQVPQQQQQVPQQYQNAPQQVPPAQQQQYQNAPPPAQQQQQQQYQNIPQQVPPAAAQQQQQIPQQYQNEIPQAARSNSGQAAPQNPPAPVPAAPQPIQPDSQQNITPPAAANSPSAKS